MHLRRVDETLLKTMSKTKLKQKYFDFFNKVFFSLFFIESNKKNLWYLSFSHKNLEPKPLGTNYQPRATCGPRKSQATNLKN